MALGSGLGSPGPGPGPESGSALHILYTKLCTMYPVSMGLTEALPRAGGLAEFVGARDGTPSQRSGFSARVAIHTIQPVHMHHIVVEI